LLGLEADEVADQARPVQQAEAGGFLGGKPPQLDDVDRVHERQGSRK
jgi:hypothetical protein